ncbi:uncharacterized protein F5147DRAFT_781576 [Suillus discolor]|uniref:DUF6533 domain-containing protein n=1 Tax=Suillus discolor TaxID=1912936 RepID=A0A9P7JLI1_9AGAM|nr:uncharacterized protein F5147DRAFT_781576 [Suillus discolor]KAG2086591.1 hypothetical protein F5147DRAFT_781576 [Suillus discolor]
MTSASAGIRGGRNTGGRRDGSGGIAKVSRTGRRAPSDSSPGVRPELWPRSGQIPDILCDLIKAFPDLFSTPNSALPIFLPGAFIRNRCIYSPIAAGVVVVYDWVLTLGREIELIWRQRWSLMTALYLVVHTLCWNTIFCYHRSATYAIGLEDRCSQYSPTDLITLICIFVGGSRKMLIFLLIIFLAITIAWGVLMAIALKHTVAEALILSGTYMCDYGFKKDVGLLISMIWVLYTIWEVLALCLSLWIAVKHFRDLRRLGPLTGLTIRDCFKVLVKSHVLYFASFVSASCFQLVMFSPELENSNSTRTDILNNACQIFLSVQMYVLGPCLILSVREYYAKLVDESDAENSMNSIFFQERIHVPTSSTV